MPGYGIAASDYVTFCIAISLHVGAARCTTGRAFPHAVRGRSSDRTGRRGLCASDGVAPKVLAQARGFFYIPIAQCVFKPCAELAARSAPSRALSARVSGFFDVVDQLVERSLLVRYHVVAIEGTKRVG